MKSNLKIGLIGLACALTSAFSHAGVDVKWQGRLSVDQMALYEVQTPQTSNLTLSGAFDKAVYNTGDYASIKVNIEQPAAQVSHVALIQAYPDGRVVQLFPNRFQPNNIVRGNNTFEIRGASVQGLYVNDAPGTYLVKLVASTDKDKLVNLLSEGKTAKSFARLAVSPDYSASTGTVWSMSEIGYQVAGVQAPAPVVATQVPQVVTQQPTPTVPQVVGGTPAVNNIVSMIQSRGSDFHASIMPKNNKTAYKAGEPLVFQLTAENDCEAGLIHLKPDGQMRVLYPNVANKKVKLKGGSVRWLGDNDEGVSLQAAEVGTHHYILTCSDAPNLWQMLFGRSGARAGFDVEPTVTVQELLADKENYLEAYAMTTIMVNP